MRKLCSIGPLALLLVALAAVAGSAATQLESAPAVRLSKAILDVTATPDGAKLFVLLQGGEVQLLAPGGELLESFSVAPEAERLAVSPDGERLYLTAGQELRIVELAVRYDLPVLDSPVRGPVDAPVTLTVFSDFQCPYCARLGPFIDELLARNPGKLRVVFKQFPLRMHNMALPAALASLAAREQGKFWPLHDLLFTNFNQLSEEKLRALAQEAGLDLARFDRDRTAQKLRDEVLRDQALGQQAGVQGTPTVYLNGRLLKDRSQPAIQALIDREVAKAKGGGR